MTTLDAANVAKNKEYGIEAPVPVNSLGALLQAVLAPKLQFISSKFGALSGGFSSGSSFGASSGSPTAAGADGDLENAELSEDGSVSAGGSPLGSGSIVTSVFKLSGPILSSSAASAKGGAPIPVASDDDSDE